MSEDRLFLGRDAGSSAETVTYWQRGPHYGRVYMAERPGFGGAKVTSEDPYEASADRAFDILEGLGWR